MLYYVLNHYGYQRFIAEDIASLQQAQMNSLSTDERVELYRRIVLKMKERTEHAGSEFLVVFAYLRDEVLNSEESPYAHLAQMLSDDGVKTIDLFDGLRQAELNSTASLWYQEDIHWNKLGHKEVSRLLMPKVEDMLQNGMD